MQFRELEALTPEVESLLASTPQPEARLQAESWAKLKAETGWKARHFVVGEGKRVGLYVQILERELPLGVRMWYATRGPVWPDRPEQGSLAVLMGGLSQLSDLPAWLRVDPAVSDQEVAGWLTGLGFRPASEEIQPQHSVVVNLKGSEEELLGRMHEKGRYNIRLAERRGVKTRVGEESEVGIFYRLLRETSARDRIGVHEERYYSQLLEALGSDGELLIAEREGEALGAVIIDYFGRFGTYMHGASSDRGREHMPNYALQWEAIRRSRERGKDFYDLRGTAPADRPGHPYAGLRVFKSKFGGEEVGYIGAHDLVFSPAKYRFYRTGQRLRGIF